MTSNGQHLASGKAFAVGDQMLFEKNGSMPALDDAENGQEATFQVVTAHSEPWPPSRRRHLSP